MAARFAYLPWKVPADLRLFYIACDGARLFRDVDSPFTVVPLEAFHPTSIDIYGAIKEDWLPPAWFTIADVQDGNCIAIDLSSVEAGRADILDVFHETAADKGYRAVIARSFCEFLSDALESGGEHYWLKKSFKGYGYR